MLIFLCILSIPVALAAMAWVFSSLRALEDSVDRMEERSRARPKEPFPITKPEHPLSRKRSTPSAPSKEHGR
jgi:hypothetical protein